MPTGTTGTTPVSSHAKRAVTRVRADNTLVLVVRLDDLDAWRPLAITWGIATRLVGSTIVVHPGGATVVSATDLLFLRDAVAA